MRSRIEDVAAVAGVSMKTVSRVLNHEPNVREETRDRVMRAVRFGHSLPVYPLVRSGCRVNGRLSAR